MRGNMTLQELNEAVEALIRRIRQLLEQGCHEH
jgi:hypothetical protein